MECQDSFPFHTASCTVSKPYPKASRTPPMIPHSRGCWGRDTGSQAMVSVIFKIKPGATDLSNIP